MNAFYLENAPLWDQDDSWQGFQWLCADDNTANTVAFLRWDEGVHQREGNIPVVKLAEVGVQLDIVADVVHWTGICCNMPPIARPRTSSSP